MDAQAHKTDLDAPPQKNAAPPAAKRGFLGRLAFFAFITAFSGAIMPGPLLVASIEKTTLQGMRAIWGLLTGHALLEVVIVALLALGLHAVVGRRRVRAAIGLVGGAALFWMGADMIWHARGLTLSLAASGAGVSAGWDSFPMLMLLGAGISLINPYFTGWWATVGAGQLTHMAPRRPVEYLTFYLGHEAGDYIWYGFVGLLVVTSRRLLTDSIYRSLIVVCGAALLILAALFLRAGWRLLRQSEESEEQ